MRDAKSFLAIDSGTTNTRVWLIGAGRVLAKAKVQAGVRDTSRTGSLDFLKQGIRKAVAQALAQRDESPPSLALAAGMITSGLGLVEIPHVPAPTGWRNLARAVRRVDFADLYNLSIYFVPGVRSGPFPFTLDQAPEVDIIRGEETEIFGALDVFSLRGPLLYIHLGSHSKAIRVDSRNRIVSSVSTLTGELMEAVRTRTVLSHVLAQPGNRFNQKLLLKGAEWLRRFGFPRTLFLIRILEMGRSYQVEELYSIFAGATVEADLQSLRSQRLLHGRSQQIILSGLSGQLQAWQFFLERKGYSVMFFDENQREEAFLGGLQQVVLNSRAFAVDSTP